MTSKLQSNSDDVAAIKRWFMKYLTSVREGDIDTYLASWSDDVIFLPPNQKALVGKNSIKLVAEGIRQNVIEPTVIEQEIRVSGDLAISRNLVSEKFTPKDGGESYVGVFKSIFVFGCGADGCWVGTHCIWNNQ